MKGFDFHCLPSLFAEVGITILGLAALYNGMDGAIFAAAIAALAGLGGYQIKSLSNTHKS